MGEDRKIAQVMSQRVGRGHIYRAGAAVVGLGPLGGGGESPEPLVRRL